MASVRPEGAIQVKGEATSTPSIFEHVWIANPHTDGVKPSFTFCKLRMKGPESLSVMTLSPMTVMTNSDLSAGEEHRFVTRVKIKYKTRTKAPTLRECLCTLHNACFICTVWTSLLKPSWAGIIYVQVPPTNLRQWRPGNYAWPVLFVFSSCLLTYAGSFVSPWLFTTCKQGPLLPWPPLIWW